MDRKKELKMQYKQTKPQMGIFIIRNNSNSKYYIEATQDLKGTMNGCRFKLDSGGHPNRELQRDWKKFGVSSFTIEILENLAYDKDESKTDYTEELALLRMIWEEKMADENKELYEK